MPEQCRNRVRKGFDSAIFGKNQVGQEQSRQAPAVKPDHAGGKN